MYSKQWIEAADQVLMHTYGRFPVVLERGEGVYLYDLDGKKYLDFGAGIAVFAIGYNNKEYNDALKEQIDKLLHTSNYFYNVPAIKACEKITQMTGLDRVFLTNSGTEAVEGAIKLARKLYYLKHGTADGEIIAMNHSFHGRSMGALSVTGTQKYREPFGTLSDIVFADYNNYEDVALKVTEKTCAIIMETVQGEGGLYPASPEFLKKVRTLCDEKGILLILDEIQCGMGRTGTMMAYEQYGIKPDVVTLAKALGCGVPVGAFAAKEDVAAALVPGDHGSTYGGNPFAAAAICKVFELFEKYQVLENVREVSAYLEEKLDMLTKKYQCVKERRGRGLRQGLEFDRPVKEIIRKSMNAGLITFSAGERII
ncbi:MAG: acetylornithine/succinylornithine family transaminase, partial [Lachnospiraceae bacterium]|nr:acetylornithine/succinylornithine family transaminase [Lachnospiraceae bacterium]